MENKQELDNYRQQLEQYEGELIKAQQGIEQKESQINQYSSQMFGSGEKQNLVEWELDFKSELEDIGHSLRCDVVNIDKEGNQFWGRNPDEKKIILNELGVNDILRKVVTLVNKNKVLSNYTIEEIRERVNMIGHEIRALIYNNYEDYGINNSYKMNNFGSMVLDILDIIESAYRRSLGGETHKGLNEQRLVSQSESMGKQPMSFNQSNKKSHWYNPSTWGN